MARCFLSLSQKKAIRDWYFTAGHKPTIMDAVFWFFTNFQRRLSPSGMALILSERYKWLDTCDEIAGAPLPPVQVASVSRVTEPVSFKHPSPPSVAKGRARRGSNRPQGFIFKDGLKGLPRDHTITLSGPSGASSHPAQFQQHQVISTEPRVKLPSFQEFVNLAQVSMQNYPTYTPLPTEHGVSHAGYAAGNMNVASFRSFLPN